MSRLRLAALLPALAIFATLALTACGSDSGSGGSSATTTSAQETSSTQESSATETTSATEETSAAEETSATEETTKAGGAPNLPDELGQGYTKVEGRTEGDTAIGAYANDEDKTTVEFKVRPAAAGETNETEFAKVLPGAKNTSPSKGMACGTSKGVIACVAVHRDRVHITTSKTVKDPLDLGAITILAVSKTNIANI